jgi:HK97 gp10 family phage protein
MSKKINPNLLAKEIIKVLSDYKDDISNIVEQDANEVGKEAVAELKQTSPKGARKEYCKGWRLKKDKLGKNRYTVKIHNKTDSQLTHLLEFGHATRNGGHTEAQPHIRPIEEEYSKKFEQKIRKDIGGLK